MADLQTQYTNSLDQNLQQRVQMAIVKAAENISSEAPSAPLQTYLKRQQLAHMILTNPQQMVPVFTLAVCAQDIDQASTDVAISNMVAAVWNGIAGVST